MGGLIYNKSSEAIWITAYSEMYCLGPQESSESIDVSDADGLLLTGRSVYLKTLAGRSDNRETYKLGAIKVGNYGKLVVTDAPTKGEGSGSLVADLSFLGLLGRPYPFNMGKELEEKPGYKSLEWCMKHPGWLVGTLPIARSCQPSTNK